MGNCKIKSTDEEKAKVNEIPYDILHCLLKIAVNTQNFEKAVEFRDELKRREREAEEKQ